jgi:hypothetical protein
MPSNANQQSDAQQRIGAIVARLAAQPGGSGFPAIATRNK